MVGFKICLGMLLVNHAITMRMLPDEPTDPEPDPDVDPEDAENHDITEINSEVIGLEVVDGDIKLPEHTVAADFFEGVLNSAENMFRSSVKIGDRLWVPSIPYVISSGMDSGTRRAINHAIKEYGEKTCIRFKGKDFSDTDYINFVRGYGCWSYLGKTGGPQTLSLGPGCGVKRIAVHEIMHALGYLHEHSRRDRNNYVTIHWQNIKQGAAKQFNIAQTDYYDNLGVPYNYESVMHYRRKAFSRNGLDTITRTDGVKDEFGQPDDGGLTINDAKHVNLLYECTGWANWGDFGACDADCGGGWRHSTRICTQEPCDGSGSRSEGCNTQSCGGGGGGGCFPSDAFVRNEKGLKIEMKDLNLREKVLTMDSTGRPIYSEITMMLHSDSNRTVRDFVTIATHGCRQITLTSYHLLPLSTSEFIFAKDVKPGQNITIFDEIQKDFKTTEVTSMALVTKRGLYAPLSMEGTLVVNDVYVSCYALFPSHSISHFVFSLWRAMYANFDWLLSYRTDAAGIHWYPSALLSTASYFNLLSQ